uniref:Uncharacterized protein n=1 Tax=Utricularia reniformis TaxID=192314 RepID=A0A1Y0B3K7_9LAMI|nr:hypothetical protein AEK19_MT1807 [Utricularia reniformis]ART31978.1 hypothetical protein AEK19_MT1807 [Utricularia reniformis]
MVLGKSLNQIRYSLRSVAILITYINIAPQLTCNPPYTVEEDQNRLNRSIGFERNKTTLMAII